MKVICTSALVFFGLCLFHCGKPQGISTGIPSMTSLANNPAIEVLLVSAGRTCDGADDDLMRIAESTTTEIYHQLTQKNVEMKVHKPIMDPLPGEIESMLGSIKSESLLIVYTGHAQLRCENTGAQASELCFKDNEKLSVNEWLKSIPSSVRNATVILDACYSANVDVRSPNNLMLSVISATPGLVATKQRKTLLSEGLMKAFSLDEDVNCDGLLTDNELFDIVNQVSTAVVGNPPAPKLRRNTYLKIPLYALKIRRECGGKKDRAAKMIAKSLNADFKNQKDRLQMGGGDQPTDGNHFLWKIEDDSIPLLASAFRNSVVWSDAQGDVELLSEVFTWPEVLIVKKIDDEISVHDAKGSQIGKGFSLGNNILTEERLLKSLGPQKLYSTERNMKYVLFRGEFRDTHEMREKQEPQQQLNVTYCEGDRGQCFIEGPDPACQ